jgi:N-6 DNA Methylase
MAALTDITARLAKGTAGRTEADIQADVRALLLEAPLHLADDDLDVSLEAQAGGGRRIDIEAGCAVIEVKKSLGSSTILAAAIEQLAEYVRYRTEERTQRYVGVLTDGKVWILYHLAPSGELAEVSRFQVTGTGDLEGLAAWLETVLATADRITPTPTEIVRRLGADSPAAQLDLADLHSLYQACRKNPEVQVKRELWARLLLSALGTSFEDSDELFVTHTYLVLIAELIAHEVMGLPTDAASGDVRELLEGQQFAIAGLYGVVEADFFDWPATITQGQPIIAAIARRLSRFNWAEVEHDVLKALYESVIDSETRHRLGEYYTPDWLAEKIVIDHFDHPLEQRLLDPACGSGTFLFWAVRRLLAACEEAGLSNHEALERVVAQVQGMDLHPVAVTLARVTYLLALTPKRLEDRGELTVPVFLGDSVRWEQDDTVLTEGGMTVRTADQLELVDDELHFPEGVVEEPKRFDRLVAELAGRAAKRRAGAKPPKIASLLNRHNVVAEEDRKAVEIAFKKLCRLHDDGRDHVWSYYIRNLARPLSFMRSDGHADVLVGNPPWLSYRSMPAKLQKTYRRLAEARGLWAGGKVATHQDLSDLFVARSVEQYLRPGGTFAFVMPFAVLSRRQYAGFRTGEWGSEEECVSARLIAAEDFANVKPPLFAVPCCVVCGIKAKSPLALAAATKVWTGNVPNQHLGWASASAHLRASEGEVAIRPDGEESPYRGRFRQGASLVPRVLVTVVEAPGGPIGVTAGRVRVQSARSANEKRPWKDLPSLEGVVERRFVAPMHLGATIVAYRARIPQLAIAPHLDDVLIDGSDDRIDEFPGLAAWWHRAEQAWDENKTKATRLSLLEQVDFQSKLRAQLPISPERVVYTKSGQHLAACRIDDPEALIDHTLYWCSVASPAEGRYLCAVLNSGALADAVTKLQSRGQHNPRHFDMHVFALPFAIYDPSNDTQRHLAELAERAEQVAEGVELDDAWQFQRARRVVREALSKDGIAAEIDSAVDALITQVSPSQPEPPSGPHGRDLLDALSEAKRAAKPRRRKKKPRAPVATPSRQQVKRKQPQEDL